MVAAAAAVDVQGVVADAEDAEADDVDDNL
jgi:hypothetical protein